MKYVLVAVAIVGLVLMSGKVNIRVEHGLHVPKPMAPTYNMYTKHFIDIKFPFIHKQVDIYLGPAIKEMGHYAEVQHAMSETKKGDKIVIHLSGYGGDVAGVNTIMSAVKNTEASTTMVVEGPSYSGHAYLALMKGVELKMSPNTFLMLHFSSILDLDCEKLDGQDRGVSNVEHCNERKKANIRHAARMLSNTRLITVPEVMSMSKGHDLYLTDEEVQDRILKEEKS